MYLSAPHPIRGKVPYALQLDAIIGPCFVQQDPINSGLFSLNQWVRLMKAGRHAAQVETHQLNLCQNTTLQCCD